jgi:pimeloyl-ACP methyl ester carboxylesterase
VLLSILNQEIARHQRDTLYEQLAKPGKDYSVYNNKHYQGEVLLKEYQVEQVFQDKPSGFYALGLVSVSGENPPVLVIRGFGNWGKLEEFPTEFFPYKDIPDVVLTESDQQFQAAKQLGVIEWLQDKAMSGIKPDVVGQSLGGKIGQQLAVACPEYIQSLVTFNSIGISAKEVDRYQGNVNIFHYVNPDDLFCYILGEKFLPGTIFQARNSTIQSYDLLGQHNNLILDNSKTVVEKVEIEAFYWVRELYKSVKDYSKAIRNKIEDLRQIAKNKLLDNENELNKSEQPIGQRFENSRQAIELGFNQIKAAIRQELVKKPDSQTSHNLIQEQITSSIRLIQQEVENLSDFIQPNFQGTDGSFKSFSQTLQQELKDSIRVIQQKLDQFLQVETKLKETGTLNDGESLSE